jgi:3-methyladenine DNA glycosylase/8-oxoguanine DNA glycosylase
VLFGAHAASRAAAQHGIERVRFALGVDDDLRAFYDRFRWDPLIGPTLRRNPYVRVRRRPDPFEALTWAVTEQLIEFGRAVAIQRRLVARLGRRCAESGLRDLPDAATVAREAPARLESFGLTGGRAVALIRAAREVAAGRIDLAGADHERAWRRLRTIPGIGRWTVEMLALTGQGRLDQVPAGDLGYLKLVGRLRTGRPQARATEEEVRELFARYEPWAGLAGAYLWASAGRLSGLRAIGA